MPFSPMSHPLLPCSPLYRKSKSRSCVRLNHCTSFIAEVQALNTINLKFALSPGLHLDAAEMSFVVHTIQIARASLERALHVPTRVLPRGPIVPGVTRTVTVDVRVTVHMNIGANLLDLEGIWTHTEMVDTDT